MLSKQRIYATALLFTAIVGGTGCHRAGKLDGDVFIVTQGAENLKLGLVEVKVLPYEETKNSIAQTRAQVEREMADLQPKLDAPRVALASAEARGESSGRQLRRLHGSNESSQYCWRFISRTRKAGREFELGGAILRESAVSFGLSEDGCRRQVLNSA